MIIFISKYEFENEKHFFANVQILFMLLELWLIWFFCYIQSYRIVGRTINCPTWKWC